MNKSVNMFIETLINMSEVDMFLNFQYNKMTLKENRCTVRLV